MSSGSRKLQTELKHVSDQLNKLQTSQSLLQSFLAKEKLRAPIFKSDAPPIAILLTLLPRQLHSFS